MKVALICCGRMENQYAVEFVEYYKQLGIDHIYIADNNRKKEEHFEEVLQKYIDEDFVTVYNYRRYKAVQIKCYHKIYQALPEDYDWVTFLDFDEFLVLNKDKNIKDYLSRKCFKDYNQILINWMTYTDGNVIYNDGRPCLERFIEAADKTKSIKYNGLPENSHIKQIIRTKIPNCNINQHFSRNKILKSTTCNASGNKIVELSPFQNIDWDLAYIKHFPTKTIDEFVTNKFIRGTCDGNKNFLNYPLEWFFKYNELTEEKLNYLKKHGFDVDHFTQEYIDSWWPYD